MKIKIKDLLKDLENKIKSSQAPLWLLEKLTNKTSTSLLTLDYLEIPKNKINLLNKWVNLITKKQKPIQYILENIPFCNLNLKIIPPILIPRPETEEWVLWLIEKLKINKLDKKNLKILDLCTGSGCIGLALAKNLPNSKVTAIDINPKAIKLAKYNKKINKIKNISFKKSNLFLSINKKNKFDLIVSNPPYIRSEEWVTLDLNIKNWEDKKALIAKKHGLEIIEKIIKKSPEYFKKNNLLKKYNLPIIIIEFGINQKNIILSLFEKYKYKNIMFFDDFAGNHRWVGATFDFLEKID